VKRTGAGIIVLAVLGGLGLIQLLFFAFAVSRESAGDYSPLAVVLIFILFLGLVSTGIMFWRTREQPSARGIGRAVVGTLALAGVLFLIVLALIIVVFAVCVAVLVQMK
jgi:hypothetical protein